MENRQSSFASCNRFLWPPEVQVVSAPPSLHVQGVLGQTTAQATKFTIPFKKGVGSFMLPSSFMCGDEGNKANGLTPLPSYAIIWTEADVEQTASIRVRTLFSTKNFKAFSRPFKDTFFHLSRTPRGGKSSQYNATSDTQCRECADFRFRHLRSFVG